MAEDNNKKTSAEKTGRNPGMKGIDKAPGEETANATDNPVSETQKGKTKNDGDPSKESDKAINQA